MGKHIRPRERCDRAQKNFNYGISSLRFSPDNRIGNSEIQPIGIIKEQAVLNIKSVIDQSTK